MNPDWSVAPTDLLDYLKALGWSSLGAAAALRDRLYVLENSQYPRRQLVFPMDTSAPDYREAVQIVREKLAELTGVHPDILDARIQTMKDDVLRLRVSFSGNDHSLPLSFAGALVQSTERLLKAAAHFARLVDNGEIAANGYNIAVSSYVEQADTREAVDIRALNAEIADIVARQAALRVQIDAIVAELEGAQE